MDRLLFALRRRTIGDLNAYGLPRPTESAIAAIRTHGVTPAIADPEILEDIRGGAIECVPAVVGLDGASVALAGGRRVPADAVVATTRYRTGLEDLVGDLGVLDDRGLPLDSTGRELVPGLRSAHRPGLWTRPGCRHHVSSWPRR